MSLVNLNLESQYLKSNTEVSIILPDRPRNVDAKDFYENGKKYKVLWLLHGTFGDHTDWVRKSMIELYACEKDLVVVMASALNSDYSDWTGFGLGFGMESFLIQELMPLVHNWFPASAAPEDNFIAGLSMGGRGTLKLALKYPELFGAAAVLSAVPQTADEIRAEYEEAKGSSFGARLVNTVREAGGIDNYVLENETWKRIFKMHEEGTLPRLIFGCGEADRLFEGWARFRAASEQAGLPIAFGSLPAVGHEWRFWNQFIQTALEFFELKDGDTVKINF